MFTGSEFPRIIKDALENNKAIIIPFTPRISNLKTVLQKVPIVILQSIKIRVLSTDIKVSFMLYSTTNSTAQYLSVNDRKLYGSVHPNLKDAATLCTVTNSTVRD